MEQLESLLMAWLLQMQGKRVEPDGDGRLGQVAKESGEALPEDKYASEHPGQCPNLKTTQQKLPKE